jgi:hypothetical protein
MIIVKKQFSKKKYIFLDVYNYHYIYSTILRGHKAPAIG